MQQQQQGSGLSVGFKIASVVGAVVLSIVVFMLLYFPDRQVAQLFDGLAQKTTSLAGLVAQSIEPTIEFDRADEAEKVLRLLEADSDFLSGAVFKSDGSLFAAYRRGGTSFKPQLDGKTEAVQLFEDRVVVRRNVATALGEPGTLVVTMSTASADKEASTVRRATLVVSLVILALGILTALILGRSVGRRLGTLDTIAARVASGDLRYEPLDKSSGDEIGRVAHSFDRMLESFSRLVKRLQDIAAGDLSLDVEIKGDLAVAVTQVLTNQREMVGQIRATALRLTASAGEFLANARQQERGAVEQSSSVDENRRTLETLLTAGREIAGAAQLVLNNAERTQKNSQLVGERIAVLSEQTERITEILQVIKDIANKSEILALNAALEGTKAGEAGRGFSLVAQQMQRLAESVMASVTDIKELTTAITRANEATVLATEETIKIAADTTRSSRQISLTIQQQQSGLEQVSVAFDDVSHIARGTAEGSREIVSASQDLVQLSERLQTIVERFVTPQEHLADKRA